MDNWFPIVDPFTGNQYGQIKVLLAMGAAEQVHVVLIKILEHNFSKKNFQIYDLQFFH